MPAMLNRTDDVLAWLDFARVDVDRALQLLDNVFEHLQIDPVSNHVFKKANTGAEVNVFVVHRHFAFMDSRQCLTIVSEQPLEEDASRSPSIVVDPSESSEIEHSPRHVDDHHQLDDNESEALSNRTVVSNQATAHIVFQCMQY
jgi:hypothetical protein